MSGSRVPLNGQSVNHERIISPRVWGGPPVNPSNAATISPADTRNPAPNPNPAMNPNMPSIANPYLNIRPTATPPSPPTNLNQSQTASSSNRPSSFDNSDRSTTASLISSTNAANPNEISSLCLFFAGRLTHMESQIGMLESEKTIWEKEKGVLQREVVRLNELISQKDSEAERCTALLATSARDKRGLAQKIESTSKMLAALEKRNKELKGEVAELKRKQYVVEEKVVESDKGKEDISKTLDALNRLLGALGLAGPTNASGLLSKLETLDNSVKSLIKAQNAPFSECQISQISSIITSTHQTSVLPPTPLPSLPTNALAPTLLTPEMSNIRSSNILNPLLGAANLCSSAPNQASPTPDPSSINNSGTHLERDFFTLWLNQRDRVGRDVCDD